MKEQKKKVPDLRFKGFTDDWEQRKLLETQTTFTDGNYSSLYPQKEDFTTAQNGVPFLTGSDIYDGKLNNKNCKYITHEKNKKLTSGHVAFDDVVIAVRGSLGNIGYASKNNEGWNINSQLAIIRTNKDELNGYFIFCYLITNEGLKAINSRITGTALKQLPIKQLSSIYIPVIGLKEQNLISKIFKLITNQITLQQRKLDLLNQLKKGLLQKMFADKDSKRPILRFNGFTDDWEERKLGDVTDIKTGSRNHQDSVENGKYPFFVRSEKIERLDEYDFDTTAILIPGDGRIGEIFHYYDGKFALHQRVYKVDNFNGIDVLFLLSLFRYSFRRHALRLNAQGTVPSLCLLNGRYYFQN
ncbi:type-i specificity determinant subunit [Limosilactobacillus frumenti DSM 13145]|uniref:Type-i specificity determinant subunit n=1 Tax=Limosilactobacillus frumenti DSM 13145 TaxID=1423746 RepID=A0A0R1PFB1_9LACO|nr:restriction endonuclease subunit S [Limosilactobacillus frumenti]KRL28677.1 type-i specificity determinant subunit [Limosilactobacillus frumenti DSM 13145]QFG72258.1 restriction endonuclease subunit S [Limosilactobacillus frumenti]